MTKSATQERAVASYESGAYGEAIELFEKALEEQETAECWNDLGCSQSACKLRNEAEVSFRRALSISPGYGSALLNLGVLLSAQGRNGEALPILSRAAENLDEQGRAALAPLLEHCSKEARKLTAAPFSPGTRKPRLLCCVTDFLHYGSTEANSREAWTLFESLRAAPGGFDFSFSSIEASARQRQAETKRRIDIVPPADLALYLKQCSFDLVHAYSPLAAFPANYGVQHQPMVLTVTANDPAEGCSAETLAELRHLIDFGRLALVCQSDGGLASLERAELRVAAVIPPVVEAPPQRPPTPARSEFVAGFATAPLIREHWESRGIELLLGLAALCPEVQFLLAWRTAADDIEDCIAARGLRNVTVLAGRLDMESFYDCVDAIVLPFGRATGNHGCPLSAVEGMLRGKPVLATQYAGIAQWLRREGAGIVTPANVDDLRRGLAHLRSEARELGLQARRSAQRHFDRASAVAAYRKVYADMLEKPKGPALREWELRVHSKGNSLVRGRPALARFYKQSEVAAKYTTDRFSLPPFRQIEELGRAAIARLIEMRFGARRDLKLLDMASGTGRLLPCLVPFGSATALDGSGAMLLEAQRRKLPGVRFLEGDIFDFPMGEKFHVLTCGRVLRHFEYPDRRALYRRFRSLLREDGIAIVEVPNRMVEYEFRDIAGWENFQVYDVFWTLGEFREELQENGLQLISFVSVGTGSSLHTEMRASPEPAEYAVSFGMAGAGEPPLP